ncbi:MAG TPA: PspC domain-containing protein [Flavisolibacter sp.]|jgi:phage shock protein PspC (stress-responsive transcriptional regulator)|nr:PspC domain-containing protein [Flavisolibacter sp.]
MKKIININLSGRVIPIEDSAYESLQRYIESLRRYFAREEGRDEIINDIESRIAELMNDKVRKGASAVSDSDIEEIINSMGRVEDFQEADAAEKETETQKAAGSSQTSYSQAPPKRGKTRLFRDMSDKLLGGVCSGIANYMNVDPAIVRLLFAIITFGGFGMGILIYIILWIILPAKDLDSYVGKRLFRNPDDRVISGVAGGLGAYFDKPTWAIRLIFAAPLLLNITFGVINSIFFISHRDIFPNLFIGSFTGTFCLAYIILWIVLPEARSPFEKMEMRGEKVDVNRIRQNVQEGMSDFKGRMESWGEEVKTSAQQWSARATEFANTRGKAFAGEMAEQARPVARGLGHIIGVLFKAFFIFVAGCIALGLFVGLMVFIFGGVAFWPINNFLWTSSLQKALAWGTLIFFIGVPIVGFMTWLIRRVVRVRSRNRYLGWIFGGLWTIGWFCAVSFAASMAKDLRVYDRTNAIEVPVNSAGINKMTLQVNEPEIRYSGNLWFIHDDNAGWDINDNQMKYNNVKVRVGKSDDSAYHIRVYKYSAGRSLADVQERASQTGFSVSQVDSTLNLSSGLTIDQKSKFRGQAVLLEILVPVGRKVRFDESLIAAYNPWVIRKANSNNRYWNRRYNQTDWDDDDYLDWKADQDYIMTAEGKLRKPEEVVIDNKGVRELKSNEDCLQLKIEEREKQLEEDKKKLEEIRIKREQESTTIHKKGELDAQAFQPISSPFVPLII